MLTVAVCTYNRAAGLDQTLRSIVNADPPSGMPVEIVVVNNNSTDETDRIVSSHASKDARVRAVDETRQGLSHTRNAAIATARGDYVAFTDDDIVVEKSWLVDVERVIKEARPACFGGKILPRWESEKPGWLGPELYPMLALLDFHVERVLLDIPKIWGANMAVHIKTARRMGGFSINRGRSGRDLCSGGDTEFVSRLIEAGEQVLYDPGPTVWHRIGRDRMRKSYFRKWCHDNARCHARYGDPDAAIAHLILQTSLCIAKRSVDYRTWIGAASRCLHNQMELWARVGELRGLTRRMCR